MKSNDPIPRTRPTPLGQPGDLVTVIDSLLDHKWLIAITTGIVFLLGCAYALLSPPVYETDVLIKVEGATDASPPPMPADALSYYISPFNAKSSAESEIQILGSRYIVSQAVESHKLYIEARPRYFPLIGPFIARHSDGLSIPGILGWGGFVWGKEKIDVATFDVPEKLMGKEFVLRYTGGGRYEVWGTGIETGVTGRIGTVERFRTADGPITLNVTGIQSRPGGEFTITRKMEQQVVEQLQRDLKITELGTKSNVIKASMRGKDPVLLADTVSAIANGYITWNRQRKARIAQDSLSYLNTAIPRMENQVRQAESEYTEYRRAKGLLDIDNEEKVLTEQIAEKGNDLLALKLKRREISATMADGHPNVRAMDQQIEATQREIGTLKARVQSLPIDEQGALELWRKVKSDVDLYSAMRKYAEEMRLVSAGKTGTAEIVDPVEVPKRPVRPIKWLIVLVSLGAGACLGGAWAIVRDRMLRGVTDTDDIESWTGLGVYATVPISEKQAEIMRRAGNGLPQQLPLAISDPRDPAVESLRIFRPALQLLVAASPNNVVMIAGPLPGIGKSFLSANLAALLASGGKRVLLIDGDLRKGQLFRFFNIKRTAGFSDVLSEQLSLTEAIIKGVAPNLDLLQSGVYPPNPAELLMSDRFRQIVGQASREYDLVLIDAPAVLPISDAAVMAPVAGSVFLVARFAETLVGEIDESVKQLVRSGARISGILLNGVRVHTSNYALSRRYGTHAYTAYRYDAGPQ